MTCYKIVYHRGNERVSCVIGYEPTATELLYDTDGPTRADVGGCLVFERADDALAWMAEMQPGFSTERWELWRCEAKARLRLGYNLPVEYTADYESIIEAWSVFGNVDGWPAGTLAFKRVTLTEQLLGAGMGPNNEEEVDA